MIETKTLTLDEIEEISFRALVAAGTARCPGPASQPLAARVKLSSHAHRARRRRSEGGGHYTPSRAPRERLCSSECCECRASAPV